jgi:serine/threonine protein kinase
MNACILIVDDTRDNRNQLARQLVRDGFKVITAESGSGGLDALEINEVQAVLLQATMPDMTGIEVLGQIRKSHSSLYLPVIMLSTDEDIPKKAEVLALGASDWLSKRVDYEFLKERLQHLIAKVQPQIHRLLPGATLGHFRLDRMIGQGGMGKVFGATDLKLQREVAIKVVLPSTNPSARQRFLREGRAVAQVAHPNVVTIHEIQEHPLPYIVMEMVHGRTIEGLKNLTDRKTHHIIKGICKALDATHRRGILHRDLKPSNIMLSDSGDVKVMDFGLAKFNNDAERLTETGEILGTPYYLSPEHFEPAFGQVDHTSDIFAVGSILYEMLTGTIAFGELGFTSVMLSIISKDLELPESCHPLLSQICLKALEKNQLQRYHSAQEILDDLDQVAP